MKKARQTWFILGIITLLIAGFMLIDKQPQPTLEINHPNTLVLLVPDTTNPGDLIKPWLRAIREQNLQIQILRDHEFTKNFLKHHHYPGVILADQIHDQISPYMFEFLKNYIQAGGHLMLIYSAATTDEAGHYFEQQAPFSDLTGTPYAMYASLGRSTISWSEVGQTQSTLFQLGIPSGQYLPLDNPGLTSHDPKNTFYAVSEYQGGAIIYPHFTTKPEPVNPQILLSTLDGQVVAKQVSFGKGSILFINLPLTYLWTIDDKLLMRVFLQYFALDMLQIKKS